MADETGAPASCAGLTALVTGASRGLGREIAAELASAGASVVLVARDANELERVKLALEPRLRPEASVTCCAADLSDQAAIRVIEDSLGASRMQPDILVNNAATQGPIGRFWENDWREWVISFGLNAFAPLRLCQVLLPGMVQRRRGKIINLSGGGATGPRPGFSAYGAAKTLLVRFTETLAEEVKPFGIDVNAIAPGVMQSAMTQAVIAAGPEKAGRKEYDAAVKLGQGTPEVVARAARLCVFLASPASNGITGRLISAAWDPWETLAAHREEIAGSDVYTLRRIVPADRDMAWGEK
jgi:NAD(P)-dependent dehydrogenase (short-subunit alcohol dehydrogenase family)